jgi:hypothetical protein
MESWNVGPPWQGFYCTRKFNTFKQLISRVGFGVRQIWIFIARGDKLNMAANSYKLYDTGRYIYYNCAL